MAVAALGGRLYAAGGRNGRDFTLAVFEEYDPQARQWSERPPLPTGRSGIAGAAVSGRLYVFGGEGNPAHPQGIFDNVEAYEPSSQSWTLLAPMPNPRHGIAAGVADGRIYLPGGATVQGLGATALNEAFDPT